jgi:hypothetical protein
MAFMPSTVVDAPASRGLRYGLLTAANGPLTLPDHGRAGGVTYEPVSCGFARMYPVDCTTDPPAKVFDPGDEWVAADPFIAYATYVCTPVGHTGADLEARVRQRLTNGEQTIAEAGLAAALEAAAETVSAPEPDHFRSVVGALEQWLYGLDGAAYGNRGYLHAPARYATLAAFSGVLVADGPVYRTQLGTIWSFGGGYPDDGRIWASGNTTVWRSTDIAIVPAGAALDRATNQYRLIAEREYAVAFDCVAAVAQFVGDVPPS